MARPSSREPLSRHDILLWAHVIGAIVWLGGGIFAAALLARVRRSGDITRTVALAHDALAVCQRLFIPAIVVVLGSGIWILATDYHGHWPLWAELGAAGWAASFLIGLGYLDPQVRRIRRLQAAGREGEEALRRAVHRLLLVSRCETTIIFAVATVMVLRPT